MFGNLDFDMIANNNEGILVKVVRQDRSVVNLTGYLIKWGMFKGGLQVISKSSTDITQIRILDQTMAENVGLFFLSVIPTDTKNLETETCYIHEFVLTDTFGNSGNPSTGAPKLPPGNVYLRRQYLAQS